MWHATVIIGIICIWTLVAGAEPRRGFNLRIHENHCQQVTDLIPVYNCECSLVAPNRYSFNIYFELKKTFKADLKFRFTVDVQLLYGRAATRALDLRYNLCRDVQASFKNPLFRPIIMELRASSTIPIMCPVKAGMLYKIENFTVSTANFPPYMPDSNFTVTAQFLDDTALFARQTITGSISSERYKYKSDRT